MKRFFSWVLVFLSLLTFAVAVSLGVDAADGKDASASMGGAIFAAGIAALSGYGAWRGLKAKAGRGKNKAAASREDREKLALKRARVSGGKLTEAELALEADFSLDEAKRTLTRLAERGVAEIEISSGGAMVYSFPGLISDREKLESKPVSEA